jgi:radical SAM superfamily enzyme YgiQ (UPF0313 family)
MKIIYFNPAPIVRRFAPFEAIKGSAFFRRLNYDALRLSYLSRGHEFIYYDEQVEDRPSVDPDLLVMNVPLNLADYLPRALREKWPNHPATVLCGVYPTLFPNEAKSISRALLIGDVAANWTRLLADQGNNKSPRLYRDNETTSYKTDRELEARFGFTSAFSQLRTAFGCHCPPEQRDFCAENVLYKILKIGSVRDIVGEVDSIRRKTVYILDDDFLFNPDRAVNILERCWPLKKRWIFQTGPRVFETPEIFPVLQENGVRIIYLKEEWLGNDLKEKIKRREYVRHVEYQINQIHGHRIAVGAKIRLGFEGEDLDFYRMLSKFLVNINLDFVEIAAQTPLPTTPTYERHAQSGLITRDKALYDLWSPVVKIAGISRQVLYAEMETVRDRFYSWDSILKRSALVSQKLGIYNATFYLLLPNLSYRNNFLEKVGYPP